MSRKKIKKELVRRNTSMYDPMGVYGRGLTKNQKEGMTRRMKIEYLSPPPVRINQQLLDEYKKTLIHYGIPTMARVRDVNVEFGIKCPTDDTVVVTIDTPQMLEHLRNEGINPLAFSVLSFRLTRLTATWPTSVGYTFYYGNGYKTVTSGDMSSAITTDSTTCAVPCYWKNEGKLYYFLLYIDNARNDLYTGQSSSNISGSWTDLANANTDGDLMPFVKYPAGPDNIDPYFKINARVSGGAGDVYVMKVNLNVLVVY